jgi:hypothetical protein
VREFGIVGHRSLRKEPVKVVRSRDKDPRNASIRLGEVDMLYVGSSECCRFSSPQIFILTKEKLQLQKKRQERRRPTRR